MKKGWILSRWVGISGKKFYMVTWDVWSYRLQDAFVFISERAALEKLVGFRHVDEIREYEMCQVSVGPSGRIRRVK